MMRWLAIPWAIMASGLNADPQPPPFPATTQLLMRFDVADFCAAPAIRREIDPWKMLIGEFRHGLNAIGINPSDVQQVWFGSGDDYPVSAVVVIRGSFETAQLEPLWQQLVRDRRFNAKLVRDADSFGLSLQLPPTALPIPGLPATIILSKAGPNAVALGVNKERIFDVANPSTENPKPKSTMPLAASATAAMLWKPPKQLTESNALMAGATQISVTMTAATELTLEARIVCESSAAGQSLAESAKVGLDRVRNVFPHVARQQDTDSRIISVMMTLVESAKCQVDHQQVIIKSSISDDQLRRLLARP